MWLVASTGKVSCILLVDSNRHYKEHADHCACQHAAENYPEHADHHLRSWSLGTNAQVPLNVIRARGESH